MAKLSVQETLNSPDFKKLVSTRWTVSIILLVLLFIVYYGYIFLIAWAKPFMIQKIGVVTTMAIPLGVAVIVLSWVLTIVYIIWGNTSYDSNVKKIIEKM